MSDTPRTDDLADRTDWHGMVLHARTLERELAAVTAERDTLKERVATRTERLTAERNAWVLAAHKCGLYRGDTDISTADKWMSAQLKAAANLLSERDTATALVQEQCADISGLKIKLGRQRTELRRLNKTLRSMWDGVRFSHRVDRDMKKAAELDAERTARKALQSTLEGISTASPGKWEISPSEFADSFRPWAQNIARHALTELP